MNKVERNLQDVKNRIDPTFGRNIDCGEGWHDLISKMHQEILSVDPDYSIYQIKEKFGVLRVYFKATGPVLEKQIWPIVQRYERASSLICELTGKPGQLMRKDGLFKTLHSSFQDQGWVPVGETTWPVDSE